MNSPTHSASQALIETNNLVRIGFSSAKIRPGSKDIWDAFDSKQMISWNDIEAIVQDVKLSGKLKKEKRSGTEYLQKD
jgi:hypothetical protein